MESSIEKLFAPGVDGLPEETIKNGGKMLIDKLHELIF